MTILEAKAKVYDLSEIIRVSQAEITDLNQAIKNAEIEEEKKQMQALKDAEKTASDNVKPIETK